MLIECSRCHTRAKLPDSKEGAKVRCPECDHVYVARPVGARAGAARRKEDPTKYFLIGGAILLCAGIAIIASKGGRKAAPVVQAEDKPAVDTEPIVDLVGFDSALVKRVRDLHNYATASNGAALMRAIDFPATYAWEQSRTEAAQVGDTGGETSGEAAAEGAASAPTRPWAELSPAEQSEYRSSVLEGLSSGRWRDLVADWVPYDGQVIDQTSTSATIRVRCHHRDASLNLPDRWVEWRLAKEKSAKNWNAVSWERWISPEEEKAERKARKKKTIKTTLSDGSEVIEGEVAVENVHWQEETPPEMREEIMALIDQMIDLEAMPKEVTAAREKLENEIGKHAVPGLLMKIAEISPDMGPAGSGVPDDFQLTYEQAVQIQLLHMALTRITGYITSYDVHQAMGTTAERQASGIRQWFGWYQRKFKRFWKDPKAGIGEDPLWDDPDFKPRTEAEKREFERLRRERAAEQDG